VKRAAQQAADDVINAIMKAKGFLKGILESNHTKDLHIYCLADALKMLPDDVQRLPPIVPLDSSSGQDEPKQWLTHMHTENQVER